MLKSSFFMLSKLPSSLALLLTLAVMLSARPSQAATFKGENCARCHDSVRNAAGKPLPPLFKEVPKRQVVIVGGGLAGLSAAHFLKDFDVLVLEKEDKPGGHARREYFRNGPYPVAAVYLDQPQGVVKDLLDDLKIQASPIRAPAETLRYGKLAIAEWLSDGVDQFPEDVRPEMRKLSAALKEISTHKMAIPIADSDKDMLAKYEGITFWDYMSQFGALSASIGDMFCKDMFGANSKEVSAFLGLQYIMDMITPSGLSWPGGLGVLSETLAKELGPRVQTGAMVVSTRQTPGGVEVQYLKNGKLEKVRADAVVFATHMLITSRVAKDLSEEKLAAMAKIKYSSYVTVPLSFSEMVWDQGYSLWSTDSIFTDITFDAQNNSHFPGTEKMPGQVAVAYAPMGTAQHEGRYHLQETSDEKILAQVRKDLEKVLPGSVAKLKEARVIRWGHAMPAMGPDYFKDIQPVVAKPEGRYFFAGEDTQAPALEGAVYSGYFAARDARALLKR